MIKENLILFAKKHKWILSLSFSAFICIAVVNFLKDYSPGIANIIVIITALLCYGLFFCLWTIRYDELPMIFICLNYIIGLIFPAMLPAIVTAGIFDFSLKSFMVIYDVLIILILVVHIFFLRNFLNDKDNTFKQKILEKIKVASGISIPFLGLIIVFRIIYPQMGDLLNILLVTLAILNIYRGYIDLILYKVKFSN